ncbi:TniQ family protein [Roseateles sp.]|uniref:TniQ family protein n=1 Tax=Roseateles sp. TaxID=1971397 RepID=UPI0039ECA43E
MRSWNYLDPCWADDREIPMPYRLHGAPAPFPTESPNSWLQRLAYRYDLGFADLQEAVGARWNLDADVELSRPAYGALARACGRPVAETSLMYSIFCAGLGAQVALGDSDGRPLYKFCLACFQEDAVPYLRIEWRLRPWKACPQHLCSLRRACGACGKAWRMENAVLRERHSKARTLAHCRWCGFDQRKMPRDMPSPNLARDAARGRAVLSALANRHAEVVRGGSITRVSASFLLSNLHRAQPLATAVDESFVNLVIDRTATIGKERWLALQRAGIAPQQPGRLCILYDRHHIGIRDGGRVHKLVSLPAQQWPNRDRPFATTPKAGESVDSLSRTLRSTGTGAHADLGGDVHGDEESNEVVCRPCGATAA